MACIDAPETAQGESGTQATLVLKQLLGAGPVEIRPQTVDRYGRTVAEVYAGGRNVNLEMVRLGMAYDYCRLPTQATTETGQDRFSRSALRRRARRGNKSISHLRAPRKLKVLQASGQHKKMPYGIMAADNKYAENEIFR